MLFGYGNMIVSEKEILHALNFYFAHRVVDSKDFNAGQPYARVTHIHQRKYKDFFLALEGKIESDKGNK